LNGERFVITIYKRRIKTLQFPVQPRVIELGKEIVSFNLEI